MKVTYHMIYERLFEHFGEQNWWPADTILEMLISSILVHNTSWRNVEKALASLKPYLTSKQLEKLSTDEIASLIRSSGYYNIKAKRIKFFLSWFRTYGYEVNRIKKLDKMVLRRELLHLNGIGRETADVMLLYAFDKPVFVTDAYARRIFYRLGWDVPSAYDTVRDRVEMELGSDLYIYQEFHALLVEHAKTFCRAKPLCSKCPLLSVCDQRFHEE